jgi:membrane-associated PAP2 superfamily phosphatase
VLECQQTVAIVAKVVRVSPAALKTSTPLSLASMTFAPRHQSYLHLQERILVVLKTRCVTTVVIVIAVQALVALMELVKMKMTQDMVMNVL